MKRNCILLLSLVLAVAAHASSLFDKEFTKLVEKFDVADSAKNVSPGSPYDYWKAVLDNNESLLKFGRDMRVKLGAEKEALKKTAQLPRFYPQYDESVIESMQGLCDSLMVEMGIDLMPVKCSVHVVYSDDVNSYTALKEDGFAICLSTGLVSRKGVTRNILKGYVAHEFAHCALRHVLRGYYAGAKQRRKNQLGAGVAGVLETIVTSVDAAQAEAAGQYYDYSYYYNSMEKISEDAKLATLRYSLAFARDQEYEADLLAYRFLENLGCGDEYINGLRILGSAYDELYDEYSDHPLIISRIDFLKFVKEHPELGNKINKKLKKKRLRSEAASQE